MRNTVLVADAVRRGKNNFSKKDIQRETGISWGTMCKAVDNLLADGFLFARKEEPTGRGRPMIPLCINPEAAFYIGIDIGSSHTRTVICDLNFSVVYRTTRPTPSYTGQDDLFAWLFAFYDHITTESQIQKDKIKGIGLAISGNIDTNTGTIVSGGNWGIKWGENISILDELSKHTQKSVFTLTTQAAAVLGEYHFGRRQRCANLVSIGLGVGIGSGVISDHQFLIGQPNRPVGYIGHMLIPGNQHECTCGFHGCLESYSGGNSLAQIAKNQLPDRPELHSAAALDHAAANGNPEAAAIMSTAASYNAVGIASMVQLYSPEAIIFYGGQSRSDGFLYNHTLDAFKEILPAERRSGIDISISNLHGYQSALGAARITYENFF